MIHYYGMQFTMTIEHRLVWLILPCVLVVCVWALHRARRARRRAALRSRPFPETWRQIIEKNMPLYARLPPGLKQQLHGHVQVFLDEKKFIGCAGLDISDEIKMTIAAQACVLLLNRKPNYYPRLRSILVYPSTFVATRAVSKGAAVVVRRSARLGESWHRGPVVLAWDAVLGGANDVKDGHNVVLHEFAHRLDQEDGAADGAPLLQQRSRYTTWARVLSREYEHLQERASKGRKTVMDRYGATQPAEFFAVATETFFEKPRQMKRKHPELYEQLAAFYSVDPASWSKKES